MDCPAFGNDTSVSRPHDTNSARGEITAPRRFVLYYPCSGEGMS